MAQIVEEKAHDTAILTQDNPSVQSYASRIARLRPHQFKAGNTFGKGRILGSKNRLSASDIVKRRETRIAKRYVDRAMQSDTVLIDAMKHLMPKNAEGDSTKVFVFLGAGELMPRADSPQFLSNSSALDAVTVADSTRLT